MRATASVSTPATRNRDASKRSGGQSTSASLATEKAELHRMQNIPTISGSGMGAEESRREKVSVAWVMRRVLSPSHVDPSLFIWKLNDRITCSGFINDS